MKVSVSAFQLANIFMSVSFETMYRKCVAELIHMLYQNNIPLCANNKQSIGQDTKFSIFLLFLH